MSCTLPPRPCRNRQHVNHSKQATCAEISDLARNLFKHGVMSAMTSSHAADVSDDKVLRTLARHFLKDIFEIFFADLAPDVDFTRTEFLVGKLFDKFRKKGHVRPDFAVKLMTHDGDPPFGVFHAEFAGPNRHAMEERQKTYFHQIALEYGDPPVVAAVFNKTGGEKAIKKRKLVRRMKSWFSNRFDYLEVNLSKCLAEDYVGLPQAVAPALAAWMGSKVWDRVEQKLRCLEAVQRARLDDEKRYLLTNVIDIYLALDEDDSIRFYQELNRGDRKEVKKMVLTLQEAILEGKVEGMALGKAEGMALGKAEGMTLGKAEGITLGEARGEAAGKVKEARKAILLVVGHRWGAAPEDFVARIEAIADLERLHGIMEQALKAHSFDEIDLDSPAS